MVNRLLPAPSAPTAATTTHGGRGASAELRQQSPVPGPIQRATQPCRDRRWYRLEPPWCQRQTQWPRAEEPSQVGEPAATACATAITSSADSESGAYSRASANRSESARASSQANSRRHFSPKASPDSNTARRESTTSSISGEGTGTPPCRVLCVNGQPARGSTAPGAAGSHREVVADVEVNDSPRVVVEPERVELRLPRRQGGRLHRPEPMPASNGYEAGQMGGRNKQVDIPLTASARSRYSLLFKCRYSTSAALDRADEPSVGHRPRRRISFQALSGRRLVLVSPSDPGHHSVPGTRCAARRQEWRRLPRAPTGRDDRDRQPPSGPTPGAPLGRRQDERG